MNRFSVAALLAAAALAGCNLTYDREGLKFEDPNASKDVEPNDTTGQALPLTPATDVLGTLATDDDADFYRFTVPAGGRFVRFQTFDGSGAGCDGVDPRLLLYDASGTFLAEYDDDLGGLCEDTTAALAAGNYYVAVRVGSVFSSPTPFDYVLKVSMSRDAEPNDDLATALPLTLGIDAVGTLATTTDVDYYAFTVTGSGLDVRFQTFDVTGTCNSLDPRIDVYGAGGNPVGYDDDSGVGYCEDLLLTLPPGTYYAAVSYSSLYETPVDYTLHTIASPNSTRLRTMSCNGPSGYAYCNEITGALNDSQAADFQYDCEWYSGSYQEGACPGSGLSGYCDGTNATPYPGTTSNWIYYSGGYSQAEAEADCNSWSGYHWVGGSAGPKYTVTPLFASGANWNDWVQGSDWRTTSQYAPMCDPLGGIPCIHGGELRQVVVSDRSSCSGLTATDDLAAFDWVCDGSVNPVRFVSTGLKNPTWGGADRGRRLGDLIDPTYLTWRANRVTIWDGTVALGSTDPAAPWWTNPIQPVPLGGNLNNLGTVYVADGTAQPPYTINASRVALAVPMGTTLSATAIADLVSVVGPSFVWIEGDFSGDGANHGIVLTNVRHSIVRNAFVLRSALGANNTALAMAGAAFNRVEWFGALAATQGVMLTGGSSDNRLSDLVLDDCDYAGVMISGSERNTVSRARVRRSVNWGIYVNGGSRNEVRDSSAEASYRGLIVDWYSQDNLFSHVSVAANVEKGIWVNTAGSGNRFEGIVSTHNGGDGIAVEGTPRTALVDVLSAQNAASGVRVELSPDLAIVGLTTTGNVESGLWLRGSPYAFVSSVLSFNDGYGLRFTESSGGTIRDIAFSDARFIGLFAEGISTNDFFGEMRIGPNFVACESSGGPAGFYSPDCTPQGASDFLPSGIGAVETTMVGPVTADAVNATSAGGLVYIDGMDQLDWTTFENPHRGWMVAPWVPGPLGCSLPTYRDRVTCQSWGYGWMGNAQLYDWSLRAGDLRLLGRLPMPGAGGPASHRRSDGSWASYFPAASELLGDRVGNDDGLCEPNEGCVYTPNFGAYQGHGALLGPDLMGASLWHYETNGR